MMQTPPAASQAAPAATARAVAARPLASWRQGWLLPLAILAAGLCVGVAGTWWLQAQVKQQADAEFQRVLARVSAEISARFHQPVYGLNGMRGLYAARAEVDRATFRAYVAAQAMAVDFPGVRGFGFIEPVPRDGLSAFLARERQDGAPQFALRQLDDRAQASLFVIKFIEPADRNRGAMGLDVGSESVRRQGVQQALESGQPTVSGVITLVQDLRRSPGVLLYVPVAALVPEAQASQPRWRGLLYAPIVIGELLADLGDVRAGQMRVELFDSASGTASGALMFDSATAAGAPAEAAPPPRFAGFSVVSLPGRLATLRLRSTAAFDAKWQSTSWLFLAGAVAASLLLAALLRQQSTGRRRAELLAQRMTVDARRLGLVASRTTNAVVITDLRRRITWVNEGFERISGYSAAEVLGESPGRLLQGEGTDPATVARLRAALDAGQGFEGEILNRAKDGRPYWLSLEIQPLHDDDGHLAGFMAIELDITERKRADAALQQALRENEALLATVHAHTIVSVAGADGRIIDVNDMFCRISGYAREELLGKDHRIVNSGVQPPAFWAQMWRTIRAGQPWRGQVCNRAKDGSLYWVDSIIAPLLGPDGEVQRYISLRFDITPIKHATRALADERQRLAQIIEGTGAGTWEQDIGSEQLRVNARYAEMLGRSRRALQSLTTQAFLELVHPDERTLVQAAMRAHVRQETPQYEAEFRMRHQDGHWVWLASRGQIISRDAQGRPLRFAGIHQDVTARRELQDRLRDSHALLATLVERLPCAVSVFDADLRLVMANAGFRRLLDFPTALLDRPVVRFEDIIRFNAERGEYGPGDVEAIVQAAVERARRPAVEHQFERVRPNGTVLDVRGAPMPGGGFVTTYTDITALRQAEAGARRSDELLRGAIEVIDEAFVLYDPEDRLVYCNEKYRQTYAGVAELIVPGARFEDLVRAGAQRGEYSAAIGRVDEWVAERVARHQAADSLLVQKLGNGRTLRIVERKLPDGHIVGFRIDITELVHATEAAEQASLAKSRFLANMSHEIRTPMNAILGMLTLLQRTGLDARQADYAGKTERAARSLLGLLNDILDFSKVEAGKMVLDPHPLRIDQLLRDLGVILSANVGDKPVEVLFDIDPALPRALIGDALRLQQVLINLAGNAIKFTAAGEVVVSVRVLERDAHQVRLQLAVRDTGIGIAPEAQASIFSGFTQAEASTTRRFGGSGLGLAISQRLVGLMGGTLALHSVPGVGSTFHFELTLPLAGLEADDGVDGRSVDPATTATVPGRLRALVVDDNATALDVLQRTTEGLGWQVDTAASGEAALARMAERRTRGERYDAVFLDWQMPGLDGWGTARCIRDDGLAEDTPLVVMVTAHGREMLAQRSSHDQALLDGFLVKPVTASMLSDAVVDARRGRSQPRAEPAVAAPAPQRPPRLQGLRLLLAEDNANNQQVARELLEDEGARVTIARHGQEAVESVAAADPPYDLVLMDLQMPVMDGFIATARIRQDLGLQALPIVAMTANALASDREACLAAGMNDHVGKPFDIEHLVRVVRRLAGRPAPGQPAPAAAPAAVAAAPALAAAAADAGVDLAAALQRIGGKRPVYARMLRHFVDDLPPMCDRLAAQAAQHDAVAAARDLHTLKGLAGTLGAMALSRTIAQCERELDAARVADAAPHPCEQAVAAIARAHPALAALLQALQADEAAGRAAATDAAASAPDAEREAVHARLRELATLLENADMRATDLMAMLRQRPGDAPQAALHEMDDAVSRLDFERALGLCRTLLAEGLA